MKLESVGLRYVDPVHPSGVSMEDGTTAVMPRTMEEFVAEADRLVPGDGVTFCELIDELDPSVSDVFALFSEDLTSAEAQQIRARLLTGSGGVGFSSFAPQPRGRADHAQFGVPGMVAPAGCPNLR